MSDSNRVQQFSNYRYFKPKTHYSPKIALKINVDHDNHHIKFAYAICNAHDNFSKKYARELLDGRILSNGVFKTCGGNYNTDMSLVNNVRVIVDDTVSTLEETSLDDVQHHYLHNLKMLQDSFHEVDIWKQLEGAMGDGINLETAHNV